MTYVFDIDGTICHTSNSDYENSKPIYNRIDKVNRLYNDGNTIIFFTARGMGRHNNNAGLAYLDFFELTRHQLKTWGAKYHHLLLGKPSGDVYVDDKGISDEHFFAN